MKNLVDTHTHTVVSGHAYSTLKENAELAFQKGLEGFVCSDHGPAIEESAPLYTLTSVLRFVPETIEGVRVIKGIEANILDYDGKIDVDGKYIECIEFGIAGMHNVVIEDGGMLNNTSAMIGALQNPYIDVISHPGNPGFPIDAEAMVKEAGRLNKLVEVNNHSFAAREGSGENCKDIIRLCKKYGVRITVSSDAHLCYQIGTFDHALAALAECGFPEDLVVSASLERLMEYLNER